jgi:dCMP deaminase
MLLQWLAMENNPRSLDERVNACIDRTHIRPDWHAYFLRLCEMVASRSHDAQTQHGAVIVDSHNRIISTGYNGFPSGSPDTEFPNLRPEKYSFMIHAEMNAIMSAHRSLTDCRIYITGVPCSRCLIHIASTGMREVRCGSRTHADRSSEVEFLQWFTNKMGMKIHMGQIPQKQQS